MRQFLATPLQLSAICAVPPGCLGSPEGGQPGQGLRGDQGELLEAHEVSVRNGGLTQDIRAAFSLSTARGLGRPLPCSKSQANPQTQASL